MFEYTGCVNALREHYRWFNYSKPWSMKSLRTNYDDLEKN
jgi:hypothetical protein